MDKKYISLNVGGQSFMTSRSTLTRCTPPNSPLHRISTNSTHVMYDRDGDGAYIIDRDPEYFRIILNYLRNRKLVLPAEVSEEALLLEAEHFHINELIRILKQRMAEGGNLPTASSVSSPLDQNQPQISQSNPINKRQPMINSLRPFDPVLFRKQFAEKHI